VAEADLVVDPVSPIPKLFRFQYVDIYHGCGCDSIAFDWKERNQLGLTNEKVEEFKPRPLGFDFADLEKFIDPSRGDQVIDLSSVENFTDTREYVVNHRKQINMAALFGSSKVCGQYVSPRDKASAARREERKAARIEKRKLRTSDQ
jgi:hypothetical protein